MRRLAIAAAGLALVVGPLAIVSCTSEAVREVVVTATVEEATPSPPTVTPAPASARAVWDYCRKMGTSPGEALEEGKPEVASGWWLRCYQGKPLICNCGATCGACQQLVYNEEEPEGLADWCRDNPDARWAPMAFTGHGPRLWEWSCEAGRVVKKMNRVDPNDYDELGYPLGSWLKVSEPADEEEPVPPPPANSPFAQPPPAEGFCDPSYPDVCIPWGPLQGGPDYPDYDCEHIPFRNFRVLLPDSHGFDADGDGIGCEYP